MADLRSFSIGTAFDHGGEGSQYSTAEGRQCPQCGRPQSQCRCRRKTTQGPESAAADGKVRLWLDRRKRKGHGMTRIDGLGLPESDLRALARELKQHFGCGGSLEAGSILLQGDRREALLDILGSRGYRVVMAGG